MSMLRDGQYEIRPEDIVLEKKGPFVLFDCLGDSETEVSGYYIIKMCKKRGDWSPFSKNEIEAEYVSAGHNDGFTFNELFVNKWIIEEDNLYYITSQFVDCVKTPGLWMERWKKGWAD